MVNGTSLTCTMRVIETRNKISRPNLETFPSLGLFHILILNPHLLWRICCHGYFFKIYKLNKVFLWMFICIVWWKFVLYRCFAMHNSFFLFFHFLVVWTFFWSVKFFWRHSFFLRDCFPQKVTFSSIFLCILFFYFFLIQFCFVYNCCVH